MRVYYEIMLRPMLYDGSRLHRDPAIDLAKEHVPIWRPPANRRFTITIAVLTGAFGLVIASGLLASLG